MDSTEKYRTTYTLHLQYCDKEKQKQLLSTTAQAATL